MKKILYAGSVFAMIAALPFAALAQGSTLQNPLGDASICSLLEKLLQFVLYLGIPVAIFFIVLAGFRFVMAQGSDIKLKAARENFLYTIIGIALFFGATLLTDLIINTLKNFNVTVGSCTPGVSLLMEHNEMKA